MTLGLAAEYHTGTVHYQRSAPFRSGIASGSHTVSWAAAVLRMPRPASPDASLTGARFEAMLLRLLGAPDPDVHGLQPQLPRLVRSVAEGVAATELSIEFITEVE